MNALKIIRLGGKIKKIHFLSDLLKNIKIKV